MLPLLATAMAEAVGMPVMRAAFTMLPLGEY